MKPVSINVSPRGKYGVTKIDGGGSYRVRTGPGCCNSGCYGTAKVSKRSVVLSGNNGLSSKHRRK